MCRRVVKRNLGQTCCDSNILSFTQMKLLWTRFLHREDKVILIPTLITRQEQLMLCILAAIGASRLSYSTVYKIPTQYASGEATPRVSSLLHSANSSGLDRRSFYCTQAHSLYRFYSMWLLCGFWRIKSLMRFGTFSRMLGVVYYLSPSSHRTRVYNILRCLWRKKKLGLKYCRLWHTNFKDK